LPKRVAGARTWNTPAWSPTAPDQEHLGALSLSVGCSTSSAGFARATGSWERLRRGPSRPPPMKRRRWALIIALGGERPGDRLVAVVVREGLLAIEAERLEYGPVLDGEQDGIVLRRDVGVLVQRPGREDEDVAPAPREAAAIDDRLASALDHVVHGAARVAMGPRALSRAEHLDPAGHRRQDRSARLRMRVFERDTVVLVSGRSA